MHYFFLFLVVGGLFTTVHWMWACVSLWEMSRSAAVWLTDVFFNRFWTTVEFCGTGEEGVSGFDTNTVPVLSLFYAPFNGFFILGKNTRCMGKKNRLILLLEAHSMKASQ